MDTYRGIKWVKEKHRKKLEQISPEKILLKCGVAYAKDYMLFKNGYQ